MKGKVVDAHLGGNPKELKATAKEAAAHLKAKQDKLKLPLKKTKAGQRELLDLGELEAQKAEGAVRNRS